MRLGRRFRRLQAEHADLRAVGRGEGHMILKGDRAIVEGIGGEDGELSFLGKLDQIFIPVVKLVVAERRRVVTGQIHQLDGRRAL